MMIGVGIRAQYTLAIPLTTHVHAEITLSVDQHILRWGFQDGIRGNGVGLGDRGADVGRDGLRCDVFLSLSPFLLLSFPFNETKIKGRSFQNTRSMVLFVVPGSKRGGYPLVESPLFRRPSRVLFVSVRLPR